LTTNSISHHDPYPRLSMSTILKILITNDDGVSSHGLWALRDGLGQLGDLVIIAPDSPKSGTGMSLTFHKPLRVKKFHTKNKRAFAVSGNPADCIFLGIIEFLKGKLPDLVVSGINLGDNLTTQLVFASGTVAGAIQGAVMGAPAVAFSLSVPEDRECKRSEIIQRMSIAASHAAKIVTWVLENHLAREVDYLNVNFPFDVTERSPTKITTLGLRKYDDQVVRRKDPGGRPYFWQWGTIKGGDEFQEGTDIHAVYVEHAISITPLSLDPSLPTPSELASLQKA
jgi:5'-nucleotidase